MNQVYVVTVITTYEHRVLVTAESSEEAEDIAKSYVENDVSPPDFASREALIDPALQLDTYVAEEPSDEPHSTTS